MIYLAAFIAANIFFFLLFLENKLQNQELQRSHSYPPKKEAMTFIPEIACESCNQKFPIDRQNCPYCNSPIKSYWLEEYGEKKQATFFSENGKSYLYFNGERLLLEHVSDIPLVLRACFVDKKLPSFNQKNFYLSPFIVTGLLLFLITVLLVSPDSLRHFNNKSTVNIQNYSDLIRVSSQLESNPDLRNTIPNINIPRWIFSFTVNFCFIYSILGLITGKVWSRHRLVCRSENPIYFHFLILTQCLFGLLFYFR